MGEDATAKSVEGSEPHRAWNGWLAGRSSRREYWVYVGLLVALGFTFPYSPPGLHLLMYAVFALVMVRRVHDFGRTGWWAWGAAIAPLAVSLPLLSVTSEAIATLVSALITMVFMVWIGAIRGEADGNRFGPPPPFTWRRMLTGR